MNAKKYIFILVVAIFALAAISAFGAESKGKIAADADKIISAPVQDLSRPIAQLNNPSRAIAAGAVKELALMHNEEATQALIDFIKTSKDDYLKIKVIEALSVDPSASVTPALIGAARDINPYVRKAAIKSLGFRPEPEALTELHRALYQDNNTGVKKSALHAFSQHSSAAGAAEANDVLKNVNNDKEMRLIAAHALRKIDTPDARSKLGNYVNDPDVAVSSEAKQRQPAVQPTGPAKRKKGK